MSKTALPVLLLSLGLIAAFGQKTDTAGWKTILTDSVARTGKGFDYSQRFDPRKALLFSAVFPGLGQAYNNKYWKLPLVYGGLGAGVYVLNFYQRRYTQYRNELLDNLSTQTFPSTPSNLTEASLRRAVDFYRRKRDFTIVLMGLGYLLQIVDAHVDAHLKEFRYNPNLRVGLRPEISEDPLAGRSAGASLTFTF